MRDLAGERAEGSGASIMLTDDRDRSLHGTDFVYTDVWVSMCDAQEKWDDRVRLLAPYQATPTH